jgi:hypothetical protein
VENLQVHVSEEFQTGVDCCEVCGEDKVASSYYNVCTELMCQECTKAHRGSKATRDHKMQTVESLVHNLKTKISGTLNKLKEYKLQVNDLELKTMDKIGSIKYKHQELCKIVDGKIDTAIIKLEEHRKHLKRNIDTMDNGHLKTLKCFTDELKLVSENIDTKSSMLTKILEVDKVKSLKDKSDDTTIDIPNLPRDNLSECIFPTRPVFKPKRYIDLEIRPCVDDTETQNSTTDVAKPICK